MDKPTLKNEYAHAGNLVVGKPQTLKGRAIMSGDVNSLRNLEPNFGEGEKEVRATRKKVSLCGYKQRRWID